MQPSTLWFMPQVNLAGGLRQHEPSATQSSRDAFDEYQARRSMEGELDTRLYWQRQACGATPALGLDTLAGADYSTLAMAGGPQCYFMSPGALEWERKEQAFGAGRAASNASGPAIETMLASPELGWSDVIDIRNGCDGPSLNASASASGSATRIASSVSLVSTDASGVAQDIAALRRSLAPAISWAPQAAAMSNQHTQIQAGYVAFLDRQRRQHGRALPMGLHPGSALR